MHLWHLTADAPRTPYRVSPGERVLLSIGTWPIEPGQQVLVTYRVDGGAGGGREVQAAAVWEANRGANSYWTLPLGPFERGEKVSYSIAGRGAQGVTAGPSGSFRVGPKLYLSLLWHQHQPVYKDTTSPLPGGSYIQPWVRLHALRDYYAMPALVAEHPGVHLTFNLTPSLLWQLEDYLSNGVTDRALEITKKAPGALDGRERALLFSTFFDADWKNQIFIHARYKELFEQHRAGRAFSDQDVRDLQVWFQLAWFGKEMRDGEALLVTGERASVRALIDKQRGFDDADIEAMLEEQAKVLRAVIPIHRALQDQGQIEVSTTPFFHPILPLLIDTDGATIDRPGATHPRRFAHPEDARAQVEMAVDYYRKVFRRRPRGMWPAEGAVSQEVLSIFADARLRWIATDRGVLAQSGEHGYLVGDPDVLCRPYRAEQGGKQISVFFRDTRLSDDIGFVHNQADDYERAAGDFLGQIKERFASKLRSSDDRVLTLAIDGENAWGSYRDDGRPFLRALYRALERDTEIETASPAEYIEGNQARALPAHPLAEQTRVYDLATASWIDENGSAPGVDLGTWVGEPEENAAWELLGEARDFLSRMGATPESAPKAFEALYIAEGSDWFWWFGEDQDSGRDSEFDDLFRLHLRNVYRALEVRPPERLQRSIVAHGYAWDFGAPGGRPSPGDEITVRTRCPGVLSWGAAGEARREAAVSPVGGVMAPAALYQAVIGSFPAAVRELGFSFRCARPRCTCQEPCCVPRDTSLRFAPPAASAEGEA